MVHKAKRALTILSYVVIILVAWWLRSAGVFRGLESDYIYHPDEPKQVQALGKFLEGKYVWYQDSWYYDGYPLGLNHVDEWLLRPVLAARSALYRHLSPGCSEPDLNLYRAARSLRVLYGLLCLLLLWCVARRMPGLNGKPRWALLLFALSPLSVAVAHSATGDIGTDLFGAVALACVCGYAGSRGRWWLLASGAAVGAAFACKYNGALVGLSVAGVVSLEAWRRRSLRAFANGAGLALVGFVLGAVVLTPACFVNWSQTWEDVFVNFKMIREFGMPTDYASWSLSQKVLTILQTNVPAVGAALGWSVLLAAGAGLSASVMQLRRAWRMNQEAGVPAPVLRVAVFAYPFLAILVSVAGKPAIQPFHFSYVQIPLVLAAIFFIGQAMGSHRRAIRIGAMLLLAGMLLELGWRAERENFFWRRDDTCGVAGRYAGCVLRDGGIRGQRKGVIKRVELEGENVSVFRNLPKQVVCRGGELWSRLKVAPLPSVPCPCDSDWIFLNGPVFPRNDRMFRARKRMTTEKHLVTEGPPGQVRIGIRTGRWPVRLVMRLGDDERAMQLLPFTQIIESFNPKVFRTARIAGPDGKTVALVPLLTEVRNGDAWITVLGGDREEQVFKLYGGDDSVSPAELSGNAEWSDVQRAARGSRFVEGGRTVLGDGIAFVPAEAVALPCGRYRFECQVTVLSETAEIDIRLEDPYREQDGFRMVLKRGSTPLSFSFAKGFIPLASRIEIKASGRIRLESWEIVPDVDEIVSDLRDWEGGGAPPSWLTPGAARDAQGWSSTPRAAFGAGLLLRDLVFPSVVTAAVPPQVECAMRLEMLPFWDAENHHVFLHIRDSAGERVHVDGFPVWRALAGDMLKEPITLDAMTNMVPGLYSVELGVWNARTRKRLSVSGESLNRAEKRKRRIQAGSFELVE